MECSVIYFVFCSHKSAEQTDALTSDTFKMFYGVLTITIYTRLIHGGLQEIDTEVVHTAIRPICS